MTNKPRQFKKDPNPTRQLGCRANERDETLINAAAVLEKRDRNTFIVLAAAQKARDVLQAHGVEEASLYSKSKKSRAA